MNEILFQHKSRLRSQCRALRKSLGDEKRAQISLDICRRIEGWHVFRHSVTILTYMPIKSEADLTPLLERHPQKRWILPRIIPEEGYRMVFHPYDPKRLIHHPFGMPEPAPDLPMIAPDEIELTLAPGLAFDRLGHRLGYGGGYFDRFLENFRGVSAGVVFQDLLLGSVPHGAHDIPMQWIVTEHELFAVCRGGRESSPME